MLFRSSPEMGFFSSLFREKEKAAEYPPLHDLSSIGTDIHSHLIPGIDDGVANMGEALAMVRGFADLGYRKLVTTPHIMSDYYRNTPEVISAGLESLQSAVHLLRGRPRKDQRIGCRGIPGQHAVANEAVAYT